MNTNERGSEQKIIEAYEQGKREAKTETSNSYWRAVTGADGSEYIKPKVTG